MSGPETSAAPPITEKRQLVEWLEQGIKPRSDWRIGTEHEKFIYHLKNLSPVTYEEPDGVGSLLERLQSFGWRPVREGQTTIGLVDDTGASVSLEPGGQIELSGAALTTIHQTCDEVHEHLRQVKEINVELGLGMIGLGFHPFWRREEVPWMPKGRYGIMSSYMPKRGSLGLDMMLRTCTIQTNLDFDSEADMVKKFRVSLALQPVATALFANSPFTEGQPNGFQSYRSHIWTDTDPDRTGDLPFVFDEGFGFEQYVDYLLDVPMYFVYRDGYVDASGQGFRDFMNGTLPALPGEAPTMADWADHATVVFPEVRLKRYLEMRGADGGPWRRICALPAFWVGLLYDTTALDAAWDLVKGWSAEERATLRAEVPKHGLQTPLGTGTVGDLAAQLLEIAEAGLVSRDHRDGFGETEAHFLNSLKTVLDTGETQAQELLRRYRDEWDGSVLPIFEHYAY
ncbi:MAG: glutamate--cysteine ligase [Pseudomonadota bacterium]